MKRWGIGVVAVAVLVGSAACSSSAQEDGAASNTPDRIWEYRVHDAVSRADDLADAGLDLLEKREGNDLFVLGDDATGDQLRALGFSIAVNEEIVVPQWAPPPLRANNAELSPADVEETYYGGYRTVNAHYAHLDKVATDYPGLAKVVTYGQSWKKQTGRGGYDLKAICITKQAAGDCALSPNSAKPRFLLYTQIHAREITTGEVAWRWIDYLTANYNTDATVKQLVDTEELWVVPIANPDGVEIVQQGGSRPQLQRKNANTSNETTTTCSTPNHGVDLNRNFGSHWGGASTTRSVCGETYLGPRADSEPETQASESLWRKLFPAVRGPNPSDPSPATAKGLLLTLHSAANTVMFPWYYETVRTGNDATQRAIARQLGSITGYPYGQSGEVLYAASGSTDDWAYEKLGVAVFTIEVGAGGNCSGFLPAFSCQASTFWPKMRPALIYAAQKAVAPFKP
ncbi:M14 family zinc carboxypeptidase [Pendulispora albinea]|uniref:Peptidase M14 domain-containing protein n=1 Tax=Pendulispora albinea TaxID=2741071 RepID=A0ABZ2LYK1_9BACT